MNRQIAILIIIVTGILGTISVSAQRRPYTQLMKEIGPTFASLKKNLDSNAAEAAAQDAVKLKDSSKKPKNSGLNSTPRMELTTRRTRKRPFPKSTLKPKAMTFRAHRKHTERSAVSAATVISPIAKIQERA